MNYRHLFTLLLMGCCLISLSHCGGIDQRRGTNTGNPFSDTSLKFSSISNPEESAVAARILNNGIEILQAKVVLDEIEFKSENETNDDNDFEIDFEGPFVFDLIALETYPEPNAASLAAIEYQRIDLEFSALDDEDIPSDIQTDDDIVDRSIYVSGITPNGTPFEFIAEENERFRLDSDDAGFSIAGNSQGEIFFITFDMEAFFKNVDIDAAEVRSNRIELSKDENRDFYDIILENIVTSARLFLDADGSGSLESDEISANSVLASGEVSD